MSIHFWSGTYGFSYPDYSKNLTNAQAQPETEKQQEDLTAVQQPANAQSLELSPLRVNTKVTLGDPLAEHHSLQTLDMRKAIYDMQQDSVLAKYQHFIGDQEEQPQQFSLDVTPVEQMQTQQPSSSLIVQDNDGVVILKK